MKKLLSCLLVLTVISSLLAGCSKKVTPPPETERIKLNLGNMLSEAKGNTNVSELKFSSDEEMLDSMQLACENEMFELYYSIDNMSVALKDKRSGKIMLSNPYNASLDANYSGNIANRLNSQVIVTYLENEISLVDMYSSVDCADLGQYTVKTYDNGLVFHMSIGKEKEGNNVPKVLSKKRYEEIYNAVSDSDKELLEMYYVFFKKSQLEDSGIFDLYPEMKANEDLYYCNLQLREREIRKLSAVFDEARYVYIEVLADCVAYNLILEAGDELT